MITNKPAVKFCLITVVIVGIIIAWQGYSLLGPAFVSTSQAQQATPVAENPDAPASAALRYYYFPGTESLGADEMRVVALGTGTPVMQRAQASSCWLVELGNGEKFLFDVGTGCAPNLGALNTSWTHFDKIFLSHLHSDHFGDLGAVYVAGNLSGRHRPLKIWGPSGASPELGTRAAVEHTEKAYLWDKRSRQGRIPVLGMELEVTEFDYSKPQIVYDNNGVVISSWPAIHAIDGPISYSLTWNGLKFVYSGDTSPNKWFIDYGRDADFLIHECFTSVQALMSGSYTAPAAWMVGTRVHTSPQAAGKIFSMLQPRMAVCYHFRNNARTLPDQLKSVRQTYDGPLTIAEDFMVWNVTKRQVTTRTVATGDSGARVDRRKVAPDPSLMIEKSGWLTDGQMPLPEVDWLTIDTLDPEFRAQVLQEVPAHLLPSE